MKLCVAGLDYLKKKKNQKWGKLAKSRLVEFVEKFDRSFFLNLIYDKSLYYLLYSCTNPTFRKNLIPDIWAKMLLANNIAGF